jgi:hypothetical protein
MLEKDFSGALSDRAALPHPRFPIYRNNVYGALVGALRVRFPVVEQLVGAEFFRAMAEDYSADHKPTSAVLIHYGASFADFISTYEAASGLPYLTDVARFENAWWCAYHAADAANFDEQELASLAPEDWGQLKFKFHPAVQLMKSDHAAVSIWQWHQVKDNPESFSVVGSECAIVSRPNLVVEVRLVSEEGYYFLQQLAAGQSLENAVHATQTPFSDFDLQAHLAALFQLKLITGASI